MGMGYCRVAQTTEKEKHPQSKNIRQTVPSICLSSFELGTLNRKKKHFSQMTNL